MLELNDENAVESVREGKFMLMFYTDGCPICPPVIKILQSLEESAEGRFQFARVNYERNPKTVKYYGIFGVPIVLAVIDGIVQEGWGGMTDEGAYRGILDEVLGL